MGSIGFWYKKGPKTGVINVEPPYHAQVWKYTTPGWHIVYDDSTWWMGAFIMGYYNGEHSHQHMLQLSPISWTNLINYRRTLLFYYAVSTLSNTRAWCWRPASSLKFLVQTPFPVFGAEMYVFGISFDSLYINYKIYLWFDIFPITVCWTNTWIIMIYDFL